jgi:membrane protease YdiL (CAAX protease family)
VAALRIVNRLVSLQPRPDLTHVPILTLVLALAMSAIVAGVAEETAFRGYMQGPIERRHGPVLAILVTGLAFGAAHLTHSYVSWAMIPYYLAVAAVYGALAYLTNSILPSLILHALGNMLGYAELLTGGRTEWQAPPTPAPLVWTSGPDAAFWQTLAITLVLAVAGVAAYLNLRRVVGPAPPHESVATA